MTRNTAHAFRTFYCERSNDQVTEILLDPVYICTYIYIFYSHVSIENQSFLRIKITEYIRLLS